MNNLDNADNQESYLLLESGKFKGQFNNDNNESNKSSLQISSYLTFTILAVICIVASEIYSYKPSTPNSTYLEKFYGLSTDPFVTGKIQYSSSSTDGKIEVLKDLDVECKDSSLVGFKLNYDKKTNEVSYGYYCDVSGAPTFDKESKFTSYQDNVNGESVTKLSAYDVDCKTVGMNYVLSHFAMVSKGKDLAYEYTCATFENSMLTCSQFYTDLVDPYAKDAIVDGDVSALHNQDVMCYDGSAIQNFQYQKVDDKIRYSYHCCIRSSIPSAAPTFEPVATPTLQPSLEPTREPSKEPIAKSSHKPVAEPTLEPSQEPTQEPSKHPTEEPVADSTEEPTQEPTQEPTLEPTEEPTKLRLRPTKRPTREPIADPTLRPTEEPTLEPSHKPVAEPTKNPRLSPTYEPIAVPTEEPTLEPTKNPVTNPTNPPTAAATADMILVESYNLPKFCPFTYLAGHTKLEIPPGCAFFAEDDIQYMRDEETSAALIICTSSELGNLEIDFKELRRFGLVDRVTSESLISVIEPGIDTVVPFYKGQFSKLIDVYTHKHHPPLPKRHLNDQIQTAVLSTAVSAEDVKIPDLCGDSEESIKEAKELGDKRKEMKEHARMMESKARNKFLASKKRETKN